MKRFKYFYRIILLSALFIIFINLNNYSYCSSYKIYEINEGKKFTENYKKEISCGWYCIEAGQGFEKSIGETWKCTKIIETEKMDYSEGWHILRLYKL